MNKTCILLIMAILFAWNAQAQVVFEEDFETLSIDEEVSLEGWTNFAETGEVKWIGKTYDNDIYAQVTSYKSDEENVIWLITPAIDLDDIEDERLEFNVKIGYWTHDPLTVYYSSDYNGTDVLDATWKDITDDFTIPQEPTGGYGEFVPAGASDLSALSGEIYVAFKYSGDGNNDKTTTIQVDDVKVAAPGRDIISFVLDEQVEAARIDKENYLVEMMVFPGTDISSLTPELTLSAGATSSPASGTEQDFSDTVTYTVNSELGTLTRDWKVLVEVMDDTPMSIHEIQHVEDPSSDDASPYVDSSVLITGIVTGANIGGSRNTFYIQDGEGAWSGLYVYDGNDLGTVVQSGDSVNLIGEITEYYNLTEITPVKIEKIAGRKSLPAPVEVNDALTEELEGVLVTVKNVSVSVDTDTEDNDAKWIATLENGKTLKVSDELYADFVPNASKKYDLTGPVAFSYGNYRISPRSTNDISEVATSIQNKADLNQVYIYPNPATRYLNIEGIDNGQIRIFNVLGKNVLTTQIINQQIDIFGLSKGIYFIKWEDSTIRFMKE